MHVLCRTSETVCDVRCTVCGQGILIYWTRNSRPEREAIRRQVEEALAQQHHASPSRQVHPRTGFNVPEWPGLPSHFASALLREVSHWTV